MCTLSWRHAPGRRGYHLFFNRDERKDREPADPPARSERDGVPFLAPRDPRAGGTWMLANAHGLTVALLNHYAADTPTTRPDKPTSRGQLVLEFAACQDVSALRALVPERQRAGRYPAFLLFAIDAEGETSLWRWDGKELLELNAPAHRFLTTSSYRSADVLAARAEVRVRFGDDLESLHAQHDPDNAPFSIRMRRPDSQTVSRNEVIVTPDSVRFRYTPEVIDALDEEPAVEGELDRA